MSASLNSCSFIGLAGSDPKVRYFEDSGKKVATFSIAVSERYRTKGGENRENTEWVPLVFTDKLADLAEKFIHKGSLVYVCGKFHNRTWTSNDGVEKNTTEIFVREVQLLSKKEGNPQSADPVDDDLPI